jgi:5-methylcytosine-specific restriction endonuclease McrA
VVRGKCEVCSTIQATSSDDYRESGRYGYRWDQLSKAKRAANPLCERCERMGLVVVATEVHHIQKVKDRPDRKYDWSNLMSVCRSCHEILDKRNG